MSVHLQNLTWDNCKTRVKAVNPELANIIDSLSPDKDMPFWIVRYPYGAVIDNGQFYYPTEDGRLVPISDARLPKTLKEDFAYAGDETPTGLVLNRSIEQFIVMKDRIIPIRLFVPGDIFALWSSLDRHPSFHPSPLMWGTAGARSIFMVPNISDVAFHKKLRNDFNVKQPPPKRLIDQWGIFTTIVNQTSDGDHWQMEALLFPGNWLEKIRDDSYFRPLYIYFLELAWKRSAYWRNKVFYDYIFSCVQWNRNLKPNPYLLDTIKYLITISLGAVPGFGAGKDNLAAPIDLLQKVYVECYGLKKYAPTIMHPTYFSLHQSNQPVYYSLQHPTTLEFSPRSRQLSNTLYDLGELKHVLDVFLNEVTNRKLKIEHGVIGRIAEEVDFDLFHSKADRYGEICLAKDMIKTDRTLIECKVDGASKHFADTGTFVRGCIRVSKSALM